MIRRQITKRVIKPSIESTVLEYMATHSKLKQSDWVLSKNDVIKYVIIFTASDWSLLVRRHFYRSVIGLESPPALNGCFSLEAAGALR